MTVHGHDYVAEYFDDGRLIRRLRSGARAGPCGPRSAGAQG